MTEPEKEPMEHQEGSHKSEACLSHNRNTCPNQKVTERRKRLSRDSGTNNKQLPL